MRQTYPLISCICITNNRTVLLKRAISCFEAQNYPNKELVISYPKKDQETKSLIDDLQRNSVLNILKLERSDEETLGGARNHAIAKCSGDYVCIWDDDDWYHPSRLSFQYNSMQTNGHGYQASILMRVILYDYTTDKAYLSFPYTWDGSILCRKETILQNQYAFQNKGEDTHIIKFLDGRRLLYQIHDAPFLYVYVYHGENTWDYSHYEHFINHSELLEEEVTQSIKSMLRN